MKPTFRERLRAFMYPSLPASPVFQGGPETALMDLPLRREDATAAAWAARKEALTLSPVAGMIDSDDYAYRRLSSGQRFKKRDLMPMHQDRMLEIAWYTFEQNPFGRRLITMMTDLIVGEGLGFEAKDAKIFEAAQKVWNHPINRLGDRARGLANALALNGELVLPVAVNDVTGVPTIGFIDPYQIETVETRADNVLVPETIVLKKMPNESGEPRRIKIIQENPLTGRLEGECFYFAINGLPNSSRGRSDYLPLADWLDMFDQYMFSEVERVKLLSAFVWDLEIQDGTAEQIAARVGEIGTPQSGSILGHNQKEKLTAQSPTLNATDRSETARLLTIHITGSLGMPISWFGWQDSNRATIEGQNDVAMKTPAARQREFGGFLNSILRFGIEQQRGLNPVLFRNLTAETFGVTMPEIATKDISRVGSALAQIVAGLDTAMNNKTMSRRVATIITLALTKHLGKGFEFQAQDVMDEADADAAERQERADEMQAAMARAAASAAGTNGGSRNPPFRRDDDEDDEATEAADWLVPPHLARQLATLEGGLDELRARPNAGAPVTVNVAPPPAPAVTVPVTVEAAKVETHLTMPAPGKTKKTFTHDTDPHSATFGMVKSTTEEPDA